MPEQKIWGLHAGKIEPVERLFREQKIVAIGWPDFGDLSRFQTREEFKTHFAQVYPKAKAGAIPTSAGQLYRFCREVSIGDLVAYPSRAERQIWIGRIEGDYTYDPNISTQYPNQRKVTWLKEVSRTHFSQGALFEIGSAMSFFQLRNYAEEFIGADTTKTEKAPVVQDQSVAVVSESIMENTSDFILRTLSQELKGTPLEEFVAHLLTTMGYRARTTRVNRASVDVIAHKDELGLEPPIIKVQVKSGDGKVADRDVSALFGKLAAQEQGLFITLGDFTPEAVRFAEQKSNLRLINGVEFVELILNHYEEFDARYKAIIPLKRVYVPQAISETDQ